MTPADPVWAHAYDVPGVNPGIRLTVAWLRSLGFATTDSGDGKTHDHPCDRAEACVVILTTPERLVTEAVQLRTAVAARGVALKSIGHGPCIQATYDPVDRTATVELMGLDDRALGLVTP